MLVFWCLCGIERDAWDHGAQRCFEPCQQQAQVVADGGHHDGIGIAMGAGIGLALEAAVGFHVAKDRFDGVAPPQFPFDGRRGDATGVAHIDGGSIGLLDVMATIAPVDIGTLDLRASDACDLGELVLERVAIIRQTGGDYQEFRAWGSILAWR